MTSEGSKTTAAGDGAQDADEAAPEPGTRVDTTGEDDAAAGREPDDARRADAVETAADDGDTPPLSAAETAAVIAGAAEPPPPDPQPGPPRWPGALALLALLLAVAGLALGGWSLLREPAAPEPLRDETPRAAAADLDAARGRLDALADEVESAQAALSEARSKIGEQDRQIQSIRGDVAARADLLESLPGRVRNVESALSTLQGISAGTRNAWLVAEAEYYMQIANAQIQLANNPALAAVALQLADQRVRELADPAYTGVRRQLADEVQKLNAIEKTDIEGVTLQLASLADVIPGLPLSNRIDVPEGDSTGPDAEGSGFDRVVDSVGSAFGNMVRIRQTDEQVKPLLSPEAEYFLRQNLQLQLQSARLALLLGAEQSYRQSIADASDWLRDYFDTSAAPVQAAQKTLSDIMDQDFSVERPDISKSLELLRQQVKLEAFAE